MMSAFNDFWLNMSQAKNVNHTSHIFSTDDSENFYHPDVFVIFFGSV